MFQRGITVLCAAVLMVGGYENIWPLFGSANQLLASLALLAVAVWLKHIGKNNKMFYVPMIFMMVVTMSALVLRIYDYTKLLIFTPEKFIVVQHGAQIAFSVILFILALILAYQGGRSLFQKKKTEATVGK